MKRIRSVCAWIVALSVWGGVVFVPAARAQDVDCSTIIMQRCAESPAIAAKCILQCTAMCADLKKEGAGNVMPSSCGTCAKAAVYAGTVLGTPIMAALAVQCTEPLAKQAFEAMKQALCDKRPGSDCCISTEIAGVGAEKKGELKKEVCPDGIEIFYGSCYCKVGDTIPPSKEGQSYAACKEYCEKELKGEIDESQGIGLRKPRADVGRNRSEQQFVNALCFTVEECSDEAYAGTASAWVEAPECPSGKGKCKAPEPSITLSQPILGVQTVRGLRQYVQLMFEYLLSIVILASATMFIWGGFKYIWGSTAGDVSKAKTSMTDSIIGLILSFGAVALLNTLNPATTRYDQLEIWMINKSEFANLDLCKDYKGTGGKPIKFAHAGDPPGSAAYDGATFDKTEEQAMCNKEYYPQGMGGKTCKGTSCAPEKKVCLACKTGLDACEGQTEGFACVEAAIAGNIAYADDREPKKVYLMGVCKHVQPPESASKVADNIPEKLEMTLMKGGGATTFLYAKDKSAIKKLVDACASRGGFRGAFLGVLYKDTETSKAKGALLGSVGGLVGAGTGAVIGSITVDDVLIVGRNQCGSVPKFNGYADGTGLGSDFSDMKRAVYCGWNYEPGSAATTPAKDNGKFNANSNPESSAYWSKEELEKAFGSDPDGKAIDCNFQLNNVNAPSDPGKNLMPACKP